MISFFARDAVDPSLEVVTAAEYQALMKERDQLKRLLYQVVRRRGSWGQVAIALGTMTQSISGISNGPSEK